MDKREKQEQLSTRISELKNMLSAQSSEYGDWKLMKQFEATLRGIPTPYDEAHMKAYHEARENIRKQINELEAQLAKEVK